jgi:TRAP-type C4-dicarboxylate transport system substrate-binding protein
MIAGLLVGALSLGARAEQAAKYTIDWVVIHSPSVAAERSAHDFAARMEKESDGAVRVRVITMDKYAKEHPGTSTFRAVLQDLSGGQVQVSQVYTAALGGYSKNFLAINQPYLFRDYDHAETVIEGPIGRQILSSLPKSSGIRGMGITYSGGYGIFATKGRVVRTPADMAGLRLQSDRFPWMPSYERLLGIEPVSAPPESFVTMSQNGFADAVETTVARFDEYGDDRGADTVINTNHFLLTTVIAVNDKFYQNLPSQYRSMFDRLVTETAREERQLSIKANEDGRARLEKRGVKFVDLTDAERRKFAETLAPIYQAPNFAGTQDLIDAIRSTKTAVKTAER